MATGRISKATVDKLAAVDGKVSLLWDSELKGFGCKATAGGRKVFIVQYRLGGRAGKAQRVTLGVHGNVTADEARRLAKERLGEVAAGIDVAAEKRQKKVEDRAARTVESLATDYLAMHAEGKLKSSSRAEPSTLDSSIG